jgi:HlyD family secretion protein
MSKKKWIVISLIALLVIGAAVWWFFIRSEAEPTDMMFMDEFPPMPTIPVEVGDVQNIVFATGVIESGEREEVRAEMGGTVERVLVSEGQYVNKGDLLFTLDSTEARISYQQQELQHRQLVKQYEDLLKEEREQATQMTSNQSGRIKEVLVSVGDQVTEHTVVAKLSPGNKLKLNALFNGSQIQHFSVGQKVQVFLPSSFSYVEGEVAKVDLDGTATPEGAVLYQLEVIVENPGGISTSMQGIIMHRTENGAEIQSYGQSNFENLDDIEVRAGAAGTIKELFLKKDDQLQQGAVMGTFEVKSYEMDKQERELAIELSRMSLEQKRKELEKFQVHAPISGEVIELNVEAGKALDNSKPHLIISEQSEMFMKASIEELDINKIEKGQPAEVYVTAFGNQPFTGVVHEIAEQGTAADRNVRFDVKILIHDPEGLRPGMTGDCDIITEQVENVVRLPYSAIQVISDEEGIVTLPDPETGEPMPMPVRIGVQGMDHVEILDGLQPGDEVIMSGGGFDGGFGGGFGG